MRERIYSLAYADDVVLMAEKEEELRSMMERLEGYLERKTLELNPNKTKIMRFRKGGGRIKKKAVELAVEREDNRRGETISISRIRATKKWRTGSTRKGESEKSGSSNGTVGNREKKIWERLGKEIVDV